MLPPGHIAAGYLVAQEFISVTKPQLDPFHIKALLFAGMFLGFAPDLDFFYAFWKVKSFTIQNDEINHRHFLSHAPVVWLVAGFLIYFLSTSVFFKSLGLLVWLGSWSHFALDSMQYGIMWFWPFSNKTYAVGSIGKKTGLQEKHFIKYWLKFLHWYAKNLTLTFIAEIIIILISLLILTRV